MAVAAGPEHYVTWRLGDGCLATHCTGTCIFVCVTSIFKSKGILSFLNRVVTRASWTVIILFSQHYMTWRSGEECLATEGGEAQNTASVDRPLDSPPNIRVFTRRMC